LLSKFKQLQDTAAKHFRTQAQKDYDRVIADGGDIPAIQANVRRMLTTPQHTFARRLQDWATAFIVDPPEALHDALDAIKVFCNKLTADLSG
jgi:hypothetical protein